MEEREFRYIRLISFFITLHLRRCTLGLILISIVLFNYKHSFYEKLGHRLARNLDNITSEYCLEIIFIEW